MQSLCTTHNLASCPGKPALYGSDILIATASIREIALDMSIEEQEILPWF